MHSRLMRQVEHEFTQMHSRLMSSHKCIRVSWWDIGRASAHTNAFASHNETGRTWVHINAFASHNETGRTWVHINAFASHDETLVGHQLTQMHSRLIVRPWTESILAVPLGDMVLCLNPCSTGEVSLFCDYRNVEVLGLWRAKSRMSSKAPRRRKS
jgi:hypothetical protein